MADPTKEPIEPKKDELSAAELDGVTGGANFSDLETNQSPTQAQPDMRKAGGEHVEFLRYAFDVKERRPS